MRTISLSKHLGVSRGDLEKVGVFDATLGIDTQLFVDPKLLVNSKIKEFVKSREKILRYFKHLIRIHKQSPKAPRLRIQARDMLAVPEPQGLSIGYGSKTDDGTSIAKNVANRILLSISEILAVGIEDEEVIELLGLFVSGFGPDSMSDLIIHIVYEDFCAYTAKISSELKISTKEYSIDGKKYLLPTHPFSDEQIIFVPYSLMCVLPVATSYKEIAEAAERNEELRTQFSNIVFPVLEEVLSDISNKTPEEIAVFKKDMLSLLDIYRRVDAKSYDLGIDERGYYKIDPFIEKESEKIKVKSKPKNIEELVKSVRDLIAQYQRSIEDNGGNNLLYHRTKTGALLEDKPHHEDVAQRIFYMIADFFCQKANILLSGESDAGRGPVDFSLGIGYEEKVLVEIKKSDNKNIEDGFKEQIKAYQKSENALYSFYVVVLVKKQKAKKKKGCVSQLESIIQLYEDNKRKKVKCPELIIIDGLIHPSPSKLKSK